MRVFSACLLLALAAAACRSSEAGPRETELASVPNGDEARTRTAELIERRLADANTGVDAMKALARGDGSLVGPLRLVLDRNHDELIRRRAQRAVELCAMEPADEQGLRVQLCAPATIDWNTPFDLEVKLGNVSDQTIRLYWQSGILVPGVIRLQARTWDSDWERAFWSWPPCVDLSRTIVIPPFGIYSRKTRVELHRTLPTHLQRPWRVDGPNLCFEGHGHVSLPGAANDTTIDLRFEMDVIPEDHLSQLEEYVPVVCHSNTARCHIATRCEPREPSESPR